jgi:hypothetical protein
MRVDAARHKIEFCYYYCKKVDWIKTSINTMMRLETILENGHVIYARDSRRRKALPYYSYRLN